MSRAIVYQCDLDGEAIGRKKHITIVISSGSGSGIAVPGTSTGWRTIPFGRNFVHFHNATCLAKYFKALMEKADKKPV